MDTEVLNVKTYWLTTTDNPYDPFNDFTHWYEYDSIHQANIASLIARIAKVSSELPDDEYAIEVNKAIDFIISNGLVEGYKRICEADYT